MLMYVALLFCLVIGSNCEPGFHNAPMNASIRGMVNKYAIRGFGRVLTWNVKKLGACLRQDNTEQLKEVVCVILQSANVVVLQEAENLDLSCLPCANIIKDQYEWPDDELTDDFKVLVKTKHVKTFSIKRYASCPPSTTSKKNKLHYSFEDDVKRNNIFETVMRRLRYNAKQKPSDGKRQNLIDDKLRSIDDTDTGGHIFQTVEGLDMHPVSSKEVPEQDERFYNRDWFDSKESQKRHKDRFHSDNKEVKINLRFHFVNDSLNGESKSTSNDNNGFENSVKPNEVKLSTKSNEGKSTTDEHIIRLYLPRHKNEKKSENESSPGNKTEKADETTEHNDENSRINERFHQNQQLGEEEIKDRLYQSREKLYNMSLQHKERLQRFQRINEQLNSIDREIDYLHEDTNTKRFHHDNSSDEEEHSSTDIKKMNDTMATKKSDYNYNKYDGVGNFVEIKNFKKTKSLRNSSQEWDKKSTIATSKDRTVVERKKTSADSTPLHSIDFDSVKMHTLVNQVLREPSVQKESKVYKNKTLVSQFLSPEQMTKEYGSNNADVFGTIANKREMEPPIRKEDVQAKQNLNYIIMTIKSDLNSGDPFILANVKLPKTKSDQRACFEKIVADVSNVNSESEQKLDVLIMGDFHFDRLTGSDDTGDIYKLISNLQIDGENYHAPISYHEKDPITTVYGRRFDNILTNMNLKGNLKTIGPDFPLEPEGVIMPITLQRLYNNYMVSLYTSENDESDSIYKCIKAYQLAGKPELENIACKDSWVPSSYVSDHLPLNFKVKIKKSGRAAPLELSLASWNLQGDSFKERLQDPAVKKAFFGALKNYHLAVFHEFPPHDRIIDDDELGTSDIIRLREGDLTTEFGIYVNQDVKDGDVDMFVLRKKMKDEDGDDQTLDKQNMITTVGLFVPKIVISTEKVRPCFYTVKTSVDEVSTGADFAKIMTAIDKDVRTRKCDFKVLLASLNLDEKFDLDREIYRDYKYINLKCEMTDGDSKYKYNIPRSRNLADYVIILDKESSVTFDKCTVGLPGDEGKRGIDKLSDFEELTTHYPLSMVVRNKGP